MPALKNPLFEQFAQLRAVGKSAGEAYATLRPASKGAYQSGGRLNKDPRIEARIAELCDMAARIPLVNGWLNRNFVLEGLKRVFDKAMELEKLGDAIRALELIGKNLGMFSERMDHFVWDGDPTKLDDKQLDKLTQSLETIAYGQDEARIRSEKRKVLSEAGSAVVEFVVKDQEKHNQVPKMHDPEPFPLGVIDGKA